MARVAVAQHLRVERRDLDGFEGLQQAVKGTHFDILQLGRGKLGGCISHLGIGDFTLSVCAFSEGVCAQRTSADVKILVGMLLGAADRVTQWSFDMLPSDIVVIPPQAEHHAVHCGASAYAVIRLDPHELPTVFGGDPWLSDAENWREKNRYRANLEPSHTNCDRPRLLGAWPVCGCLPHAVWRVAVGHIAAVHMPGHVGARQFLISCGCPLRPGRAADLAPSAPGFR